MPVTFYLPRPLTPAPLDSHFFAYIKTRIHSLEINLILADMTVMFQAPHINPSSFHQIVLIVFIGDEWVPHALALGEGHGWRLRQLQSLAD